MAFTQDELARAAYSSYGEVTGHKNFQGDPMPDFDDLGDAIQNAWRAAALTAGRMAESGKAGDTLVTLDQITEALTGSSGEPAIADVAVTVGLPGNVVLYERNTSDSPLPEGRVLEMCGRMINVLLAARGEAPVSLIATRNHPQMPEPEAE